VLHTSHKQNQIKPNQNNNIGNNNNNDMNKIHVKCMPYVLYNTMEENNKEQTNIHNQRVAYKQLPYYG